MRGSRRPFDPNLTKAEASKRIGERGQRQGAADHIRRLDCLTPTQPQEDLSFTDRLDGCLASRAHASTADTCVWPERVEHCLTRMLPAPRRFVNRLHGFCSAAFRGVTQTGFPVRSASLLSRPDLALPKPRRAAEGIGRSGATRSHAQRALPREHGEDGEHRTFPEVSTVAHSRRSRIGRQRIHCEA